MRIGEEAKTPTFGEVVKSLIADALCDVNVSMPGIIVKYDAQTQYADVQPALKKKSEVGDLITLPVLPNVPVMHPRANGGKAFIHMPIKVGDEVMLVFSQRSIDNWKTQGGISDPADRRKFSISDAVAYIGGSALPNAFKPQTKDSIEIVNDQSKTVIHPDGTYNLYGGNGDDLVQVLHDLILGIQRAYTETLDGPEPLIDPEDPAWDIIEERCNAFVNGFDPYLGV